MALKLKFMGREEIPVELQSLYVEREGSWWLDVEGEKPSPLAPLPSAGRGEPGDGGEGERGPRVLPRAENKPREKWTFADEMAAREQHVAEMRLESEVRRLGREHGAGVKALDKLAQRARGAFRMAEGRPVPVAADGRTVLLADGGSRALSVAEWTRAQIEGNPLTPALSPDGGEGVGARRRADAACEDAAMPGRNPFRKKFWNLTEQMRLRKADPAHAARLKAEAWREGN